MINPNFGVSFFCRVFELCSRWKALVSIRHAAALLGAVLVAGSALSAAAAAPAYDVCGGAVIVPGNGPFPYYTPVLSLAEATSSAESTMTNINNGFCISPVSRGVWFSFTPATNGFYSLATCAAGTTLIDTVIALYTSANGCSGPFTRVECNDDSCGPGMLYSTITRQLQKDTQYYLVAWQYGTAAPAPEQSALQLVVMRESPPENDTCASAQPILLNQRVMGSTSLASNDYQLSGSACFTGIGQTAVLAAGRDVAYSFTAPTAGTYSIKAFNYSFESGFNLVLYAIDACVDGPRPLVLNNCLAAANRNPATTAEEISCLPLAAGQQIFVIVDDAIGTNRGSGFTLEITACLWEQEPNNMVTNASPFHCGVQGAMSPPGDSDFFALGQYPAGSRLFAMVDGEAANIPDFDLRITSLTETLEYDNNDNDPLFGQSSANVAGTPLPAEPVFVRINYNGAALAEPYRLYATVQPPPSQAAPESEPNPTPAQATSDVRNYFAGSLDGPSPSTDVDVFAFMADAGDLVFVSLDADPLRDQTPINAQLELLDASGNSLLLVNDVNSTSITNTLPGNLGASVPSSPGESLVFRSTGGMYHVRVSISPSAAGLTGAGDYLLSICRNCATGAGRGQPAHLLGLSDLPGGGKNLQLEGTPGAFYRVEWSDNLETWSLLDSRFADATGHFEVVDTSPASGSRFYRAVAP